MCSSSSKFALASDAIAASTLISRFKKRAYDIKQTFYNFKTSHIPTALAVSLMFDAVLISRLSKENGVVDDDSSSNKPGPLELLNELP